jgi:hypothetical protein
MTAIRWSFYNKFVSFPGTEYVLQSELANPKAETRKIPQGEMRNSFPDAGGQGRSHQQGCEATATVR